ncbi:hypothetical protein BFO_2530 [Tannerella forsythia 92A2]|uniref:Uncharacterized protein n=1 Tax=Tannerella forsythia (strain ATCC 43037 / JCM 10827 / CCUG 21028 A / KCTC 5666 / FDC 338) TaxID=203275 RepID=G8UKU0_TANFA|nr:hypothetical protein BFO_2530 [Tannerella forsythia 92A2]
MSFMQTAKSGQPYAFLRQTVPLVSPLPYPISIFETRGTV